MKGIDFIVNLYQKGAVTAQKKCISKTIKYTEIFLSHLQP